MMTAMKRVLALVMALGLLFALPAGLQAEELTYQNFTIQLKNGQLFVTQGNAAYYEDTFTSVPPSFGLFTATDDYETLVLTYEKDGQRIFVRLPAAGDVLLDGAFPEVIFAAEITDVRLDLETGATIDTLNAAAPMMLEVRGNVKTLNVSGDVELTLLGLASAQGDDGLDCAAPRRMVAGAAGKCGRNDDGHGGLDEADRREDDRLCRAGHGKARARSRDEVPDLRQHEAHAAEEAGLRALPMQGEEERQDA